MRPRIGEAFVVGLVILAGCQPAPAPLGETERTSIADEVLALQNQAYDVAEQGDEEKTFAAFSTATDVRIASQGMVQTVPEFREGWSQAMSQISRQQLVDRKTIVQVLTRNLVVSTTQADYGIVDLSGASSAKVPIALTTVWSRESGQWTVVNAHQSVSGTWPTAE